MYCLTSGTYSVPASRAEWMWHRPTGTMPGCVTSDVALAFLLLWKLSWILIRVPCLATLQPVFVFDEALVGLGAGTEGQLGADTM